MLLTAAFDRQLGLLDVRQPKQVPSEAVEVLAGCIFPFAGSPGFAVGRSRVRHLEPALASGAFGKTSNPLTAEDPRHQPFQCLASTDSGGGPGFLRAQTQTGFVGLGSDGLGFTVRGS